MDGDRVDALAKALGAGADRRRAVGGLLAAALALRGAPDEAAAHNTKARCRELGDPNKRRACLAKARRHARTHTPPPPPPPGPPPPPPPGGQAVIAAECPGPGDSDRFVPTGGHLAQTFTAGRGGPLVRARVDLLDNPAGADLVLEIRTVDAAGVPTATVLATATVADVPATTPDDPPRAVTAVFAAPATVATGTPYALAVGAGAEQSVVLGVHGENTCGGQLFRAPAGGAFVPSVGTDLVYAVFVAA